MVANWIILILAHEKAGTQHMLKQVPARCTLGQVVNGSNLESVFAEAGSAVAVAKFCHDLALDLTDTFA